MTHPRPSVPAPRTGGRRRRWAGGLVAGALTTTVVLPLLAVDDAQAARPGTPGIARGTGNGMGERGCATPVLGGLVKAADVKRENPTAFAQAAGRNGATTARFEQLAADRTFRLDACGRSLYVEPATPAAAQAEAAETAQAGQTAQAAAATPAPDQAFLLNSKPGSTRTLYLDFDGDTTSGTVWNSGANGTSFTSPAYDTDGNTATFSTAERTQIVRAWQSVAEDYAPFDINVTTQDPGAAALDRTSASDLVFGSKVVVTATNKVYVNDCGSGCGGIAYVDVFTISGSNHGYYQPAWVFTDGVGDDGKSIAEAAAHEAGHNFGLSHDGTATSGYYDGANGWAPIMGVGYYEPLSQWSNGQYTGANQKQDDLAIIATGAPVRTDDHGADLATAGVLTTAATANGVIASPTDVDALAFVAAGTTTLTAAPTAAFPNLDIALTVRDQAGAVVTTANPTFTRTGEATATGLDATATFTAPAGGATYYVQVDGAANTASVTDYGSLGAYSVRLQTQTPGTSTPLSATAATLPAGTVGTAYGPAAVATVSGGVTPYTYAASSLPPGLSLGAGTGRLAGTPTRAGSFAPTLTVTDALGATAQVPLNLQVAAAAVTVAAQSVTGTTGSTFGYQLQASGGDGASAFTWSVGTGLPTGLTVSSSGLVSGTTTQTGTFTATVTATNGGRSGSGTLTVTVRAATTPLAFTTPATLTTGKVGRAYTGSITITGGTPLFRWSAAGSTPSGIRLSLSADRRTVRISGTPTRAGTSSFTLRVTDAAGAVVSRTFTLAVAR